VTAMTICAPNASTSRVGLPDQINHTSRIGATSGVNLRPSFGDAIVHPTVKITPAGPVKRLGTGWHEWFSESVHVPAGSKIEFCFHGHRHLLALYHEAVWTGGETSIDGQHASRLRSFANRLTFVPAGLPIGNRMRPVPPPA
jgi:AraC family transcriptional regulator